MKITEIIYRKVLIGKIDLSKKLAYWNSPGSVFLCDENKIVLKHWGFWLWFCFCYRLPHKEHFFQKFQISMLHYDLVISSPELSWGICLKNDELGCQCSTCETGTDSLGGHRPAKQETCSAGVCSNSTEQQGQSSVGLVPSATVLTGLLPFTALIQ